MYFPLYWLQNPGPGKVTRSSAVRNLERIWSRIKKCLMGNYMQFVTACCAFLPHTRLNLHRTKSQSSFTEAGSFFFLISFDMLCQMLGQNMYLMPEYLPWINFSFIKLTMSHLLHRIALDKPPKLMQVSYLLFFPQPPKSKLLFSMVC